MPRRKRNHIPLIEKLASALADKLPQQERDALRAAKVPARQICRMFTPDHIKLHTWGGEDRWYNLDMRRRGAELKAKDAADTSRAAKADRIVEREAAHKVARAIGHKASRAKVARKAKWPTRKIPSRPFRPRGGKPARPGPA